MQGNDDVNAWLRHLRRHRKWLVHVAGDTVSPYVDEPWLAPDGIPPPPLGPWRQDYYQPVNLAVPGRRYTDDEERALRRREELEAN